MWIKRQSINIYLDYVNVSRLEHLDFPIEVILNRFTVAMHDR